VKRLLPLSALVLALVLPACGGGGSSTEDRSADTSVDATGPADAQTATVVSNDRLKFDPGIVNAKVGTLELSHRNSGSIPHNLVFDDTSLGAIDTVTGGQTKKITLTFAEPGEYDFVCTFHRGQDGKVVVT
jgi:plastocyanin